MLKDYSKILYEVSNNNQRFAQIKASIIDEQLVIQRTDFNVREYNPLTGIVYGYDSFDKENTAKLASRLNTFTSANFIRLLKKEFGGDGEFFFLSNLRQYCDEFHIQYTHEADY